LKSEPKLNMESIRKNEKQELRMASKTGNAYGKLELCVGNNTKKLTISLFSRSRTAPEIVNFPE
jgi:hypothetical protein